MRAAVLNDERRLEAREVPDPEPGPGEVVVRVAACGICGSDLHMVEAGLLPPGVIPGHEPSGVVEAAGDGVTAFSPGDAVAVHPFEPCGTCPACLGGATGRCANGLPTTIGLGARPGAFAERVVVSPPMLERLPDGFPVELGSLTEPLAVALHALRRSSFEPGMDVGVLGCGPIGLCGVLVAKALGAGRIWAADRNAFRAELAGRLGADETRSGPAEADVILECAGARGTLDAAVAAARPGGQVVVPAVNLQPDEVFLPTWVTKEVDVLPAFAYRRDEFSEAADLLSTGRVDVAAMVTRRASVEEAGEAFEALLGGADEGKVLVTP